MFKQCNLNTCELFCMLYATFDLSCFVKWVFYFKVRLCLLLISRSTTCTLRFIFP